MSGTPSRRTLRSTVADPSPARAASPPVASSSTAPPPPSTPRRRGRTTTPQPPHSSPLIHPPTPGKSNNDPISPAGITGTLQLLVLVTFTCIRYILATIFGGIFHIFYGFYLQPLTHLWRSIVTFIKALTLQAHAHTEDAVSMLELSWAYTCMGIGKLVTGIFGAALVVCIVGTMYGYDLEGLAPEFVPKIYETMGPRVGKSPLMPQQSGQPQDASSVVQHELRQMQHDLASTTAESTRLTSQWESVNDRIASLEAEIKRVLNESQSQRPPTGTNPDSMVESPSGIKQLENFRREFKNAAENVAERAVRNYAMGQVAMADFAAASLGASVVLSQTSPTKRFKAPQSEWVLLSWLPTHTFTRYGPEMVTDHDTALGRCWAADVPAFITIRLARRIKVHAFTIDHVDPQIAITSTTSPKIVEFYAVIGSPDAATRIYDNVDAFNAEGAPSPAQIKLATSHFDPTDKDGPIRIYHLDDRTVEIMARYPIEHVKFKIGQSHGEEYACVYRLRVHGQIDETGTHGDKYLN